MTPEQTGLFLSNLSGIHHDISGIHRYFKTLLRMIEKDSKQRVTNSILRLQHIDEEEQAEEESGTEGEVVANWSLITPFAALHI